MKNHKKILFVFLFLTSFNFVQSKTEDGFLGNRVIATQAEEAKENQIIKNHHHKVKKAPGYVGKNAPDSSQKVHIKKLKPCYNLVHSVIWIAKKDSGVGLDPVLEEIRKRLANNNCNKNSLTDLVNKNIKRFSADANTAGTDNYRMTAALERVKLVIDNTTSNKDVARIYCAPGTSCSEDLPGSAAK